MSWDQVVTELFIFVPGSSNSGILSSLLRRKVDINITNSAGKFPLHLAIESGNDKNVAELLLLGADFTAVDSDNKSPIELALDGISQNSANNQSYQKVFDMLLRYTGPDKLNSLSNKTGIGEALKKKLVSAARMISFLDSENIDLISRLVVRGDINLDLDFVMNKVLEKNLISKLLDHELNAQVESEAGKAAVIMFKKFSGRSEASQKIKNQLSSLLEKSIKTCDVGLFSEISEIEGIAIRKIFKFEIKDYDNLLSALVEQGNQEALCRVIDIIGQNNDFVKAVKNPNLRLINACAHLGFENVIKKLHLLYGEIRGFEIDADFPLNQAAISGNFSMVRILVEDLGYDVNQTKSSNKISPLQRAIRNGNEEVAKYLIKMGANVNQICLAVNENGKHSFTDDTLPVVLAVSANLPEITRILLAEKEVKMSEAIKDKLMKRVVARGYFENLDVMVK